ncbi:MAG TPA: hypothetical protein VLX92_20410 [Kofleriaceae bacterium]|nr:hypothetical protein [Kofleriaceae bacterium]
MQRRAAWLIVAMLAPAGARQLSGFVVLAHRSVWLIVADGVAAAVAAYVVAARTGRRAWRWIAIGALVGCAIPDIAQLAVIKWREGIEVALLPPAYVVAALAGALLAALVAGTLAPREPWRGAVSLVVLSALACLGALAFVRPIDLWLVLSNAPDLVSLPLLAVTSLAAGALIQSVVAPRRVLACSCGMVAPGLVGVFHNVTGTQLDPTRVALLGLAIILQILLAMLGSVLSWRLWPLRERPAIPLEAFD